MRKYEKNCGDTQSAGGGTAESPELNFHSLRGRSAVETLTDHAVERLAANFHSLGRSGVETLADVKRLAAVLFASDLVGITSLALSCDEDALIVGSEHGNLVSISIESIVERAKSQQAEILLRKE